MPIKKGTVLFGKSFLETAPAPLFEGSSNDEDQGMRTRMMDMCRVAKGLSLAISLLLVQSSVVYANGDDGGRRQGKERLEIPDDPYVPVSAEGVETSPPYSGYSQGFFFTQVNIDSNGNNVVGDAANEPSIAVDPVDPNNIVIGWRQFDTIGSNFRQAGNGYTTDGGKTWNYRDVIERGVFRSDPVLDSDNNGAIYYNSLTSDGGDFTCKVFRSFDGGAAWDSGAYAYGGDKQWMVIDKSGGTGEGQIYAFWNESFSICQPGHFTRSVDKGTTFEECGEIPETPFWGTLGVGPESELYAGGIGFADFVAAKSTNAKDSSAAVAWDTVVSVYLDGAVSAFSGGSPNPGGLLGQINIAVDQSDGPTSGNVYLLCSVERFSNPDPLDVMFARSTDGGLAWSDPVRVNDDTTMSAFQWFGTMSVAPDGRIDVIWLDTRDNPGTVLSSLYYSYSMDAGETWSANQRLSDEFDPHVGWPQQNKMGDYYDMVSDEAGAHLAWAATFNGEQDVYYGFIPAPVTDVSETGAGMPQAFELEQNYPNPFNPVTEIGYRTTENGYVALKIFDILGREVATLVDEAQDTGYRKVRWDAAGQPSGVYFYRLEAEGKSQTRKLMLLK